MTGWHTSTPGGELTDKKPRRVRCTYPNLRVKTGAVLVHARSHVEVEAFPQDMPHAIEVDLSPLAEIDDALYIRDLVYDKTIVEILDDPDELIVKAVPVRIEEEPVAAAAVPAEGEVAEEGSEAPAKCAPAEGGAAGAGAKPGAAVSESGCRGREAGARTRRRRPVEGAHPRRRARLRRRARPALSARLAPAKSLRGSHQGTRYRRARGCAARLRPRSRRGARAPSIGGSAARDCGSVRRRSPRPARS